MVNVVTIDTACTVCQKELPLEYLGFKSKTHVKIDNYRCKDCVAQGAAYRAMCKSASLRGHEVSMTLGEFVGHIHRKSCHYCGVPILNCGIDRKDSHKGYSVENTVPCCKACNTKKQKTHYDVFIARGKMSKKEMKSKAKEHPDLFQL